MKTDELVALLAEQAGPVDRRLPQRRFGIALLAGWAGAGALAALTFGLRPDLKVVLLQPAFAAKMGFALCMVAAATWIAARLAHPGRRIGSAWAGLAVPVLLAWAAAAAILWLAPAEARLGLLQGQSWRSCPFNIASLSPPAFVAVFWALRGLAPTRLRAAGAAGGLLAGAIATLAYCLHCPEMAVPFWSLWYLLGMAIPAVVGALLGPRLLRW